jgi:salicylate hydroxylase
MKTIAIIGGGVGGLTLANAMLHYAKDWKVVLFEQAKQIRSELGTGIGLQTGQVVLNELGFKEKLRELSVPIYNIEVCKASGETAMCVNLLELQKTYTLPEGIDVMFRAILRSNLLHMLSVALPEGTIQLDKKFKRYEINSNNKVITYFTDGTSFESDILVGADGIHSAVQEQMSGHIDNNYSRVGAWYGLASLESDSEILKSNSNVLKFHIGEGTLLGSYPCTKNHLSFVVSHHMQEPVYEKMDLEEAKLKAREFAKEVPFSSFGTLIDHAVRLMHLPLYSRPKLPIWHQGPVVLLGDACHATLPSSGQGGNQAIIDASVLARLLATSISIDEALNMYVEIREPPTRTIVNNSDKIIQLFMGGLDKILTAKPFQFWGENWNMGIEELLTKK